MGHLGGLIVNLGRSVFAQLLQFVPKRDFEYLVDKHAANHRCHGFTAWSQFVCMAYAQLSRREGLRDLVACLNSQAHKLWHVGLRMRVARSTLADANERRSHVIFEQLAQRMIPTAVELHRHEPLAVRLEEPLYAMDSSVIELSLGLFDWARFRSSSAAVKAHTVIDLRGSIPVMVRITTAKVADLVVLDALQLPALSVVLLDRGYVDFARLYGLTERGMSFVVRAKENLAYSCPYAFVPDVKQGILADQVIELTESSKRAYPKALRRVRYYDQEHHVEYVFLTDRFDLAATTVAQLYKQRWQIELFFKWLKHNLNVAHFFGNSDNALRTQIWIAIVMYLATAIARKRLKLQITLHTLLHLVQANLMEKTPLTELVSRANAQACEDTSQHSQLSLFDL